MIQPQDAVMIPVHHHFIWIGFAVLFLMQTWVIIGLIRHSYRDRLQKLQLRRKLPHSFPCRELPNSQARRVR